MRLSEDKIKQGILHPDRKVRDAAAFYFSESFSQDPAIMPLAIRAIEKHGWQDAFHIYPFMNNLVQTDETIRWAIDELASTGESTNEFETQIRRRLSGLLAHADAELLRRHEVAITDFDGFGQHAREAIREKILFRTFAPDRLWHELEDFCEHHMHQRSAPQDELEFAHRLVEAMGLHPDEYVDRVLAMLAEEVEDYENNPMAWMELFAVKLAGELSLEAAIPLLIKKLKLDGDYLNQECIRAFVKIGSPGVVDALAGEFPTAQWGFRVCATEVFEKVHSDRTVETCLGLLEREEDLDIKCRLCQALMLNFCSEGIEPARQVILNHKLDLAVLELRRDLLTTSTLMGVDFPEMEQWKQDAEQDTEFRKKWYAERFGPIAVTDEGEESEDDDGEAILPMDTFVD